MDNNEATEVVDAEIIPSQIFNYATSCTTVVSPVVPSKLAAPKHVPEPTKTAHGTNGAISTIPAGP